MKTLDWEIDIAAPREQVWQRMLLDDAGYRDWTTAFCEGSYYEGSWDEGATIRFLAPGGMGMWSKVSESRAPERVCLRHQGEIKDGQNQAPSEDWAGAEERYFLSELSGGGTRLRVELQITDAYEAMMREMWPVALQRLKRLCEQGPGA